MSKLYTMLRENIVTGERTMIHRHTTTNVIALHWRAYVNENYRVIVQEYVDDTTYLISAANAERLRRSIEKAREEEFASELDATDVLLTPRSEMSP